MTDLHLSPLQALRAAAAEILAECAENLVFALRRVPGSGIDPALATVRVRLALLDRLAEAADLFTPQVSGPCEQDPQLDGDADDDLDFDLAAAVLELELLREQKRSEVRRLNALIEEKLDQVVRLARIRRDQQLSLPMDEDEASTA